MSNVLTALNPQDFGLRTGAAAATANDAAWTTLYAYAVTAGRPVQFPVGDFWFTSPLVIDDDNFVLRGSGGQASGTQGPAGTSLHFTGTITGAAVDVDFGAESGTGYGVEVTDLTIVGSATCALGLRLRGASHCKVRVRVESVTDDAVRCNFVSESDVEVICNTNVHTFTPLPTCGLRVSVREPGEESTAMRAQVSVAGLTAGTGVILDDCTQVAVSGVCQGNLVGISVTAEGGGHELRMWTESNDTVGYSLAGYDCTLIACKANGDGLVFAAGAYNNQLVGGNFDAVTNESSLAQAYYGPRITTLVDAVTPAARRDVFDATTGQAGAGEGPLVLPPPDALQAITGLDALTFYTRCDEQTGALYSTVDNVALAVEGTPNYNRWVRNRRGVALDSATDGFKATNTHQLGTESHLVVFVFAADATAVAGRGLWSAWDSVQGDGVGAYIHTDDKVYAFAAADGGTHAVAPFAVSATALTFGKVYALVVQIDRAANLMRTRLCNVTDGTSVAGADKDITTLLDLTGAATQKYGLGPIAGVVDAGESRFLGLAHWSGATPIAQLEGAGVPLAVAQALRLTVS